MVDINHDYDEDFIASQQDDGTWWVVRESGSYIACPDMRTACDIARALTLDDVDPATLSWQPLPEGVSFFH